MWPRNFCFTKFLFSRAAFFNFRFNKCIMILFTPKVQRGNWFFVLERRLMNNYGIIKLLLLFFSCINIYIHRDFPVLQLKWRTMGWNQFWWDILILILVLLTEAWNFHSREKNLVKTSVLEITIASKLISTKCVAFRTFAVGNVCCNHFRVSNDPQGQLYVGWLRAWWKGGWVIKFHLS